MNSTVLTNKSGTDKTRDYTAYGRQWQTPGDLDSSHTYTGQREDASGLVYMNARYYDPNIGIFISPDTIIPDPTNVMDYNRYAYARGNPVTYNDPSGHASECQPGCSPHPILVGCQGSATCVRTEAGQFLLAHQDFDPFVDPYVNQHPDYVEVFRMLAQINLDNGNQELAGLYFYSLNKGFGPDVAMDGAYAGAAIITGAAYRGGGHSGTYYSVAFEMELPSNSYPGRSRGHHFQLGNEQLLQAIDSDPQFANYMRNLGVNRDDLISPNGAIIRESPDGWTWHHHPTRSGVMQLVPYDQHMPGSPAQPNLHPNNKGGYANWGK